MKRFHVHVGVEDLGQSIRFYTGLFGAEPTVRKDDYAKWMIENPRLNFAISQRGTVGINHLGLQADSADELADIRRNFAAAGAIVQDQPGASCCYAKSDKHWVADPQGVAWEGYHTLGEIRYFDRDKEEASAPSERCAPAVAAAAGCCVPATTLESSCCTPAKAARGACCP